MAGFQYYKQVIPAGFYQITLEHTNTLTPDTFLCTFGCRDDVGDLEQTDLDGIAAAWVAGPLTTMSSSTTFVRAFASDAGGEVLSSPSNTAGSDPDPASPLTVAVIVEKRTGSSGRRNRGRFYIPSVQESVVDEGGNLSGGFLTAMGTVMDDFLTDVTTVLGGGVGGMYVLHSKGWNDSVPGVKNPADEPADPGNAPAPTIVTSLVVKPKIGTQRRRIR